MSVQDRIQLFTSLCLVNRTWLSIFIRIALQDVHIVTPSFAQHFLRLLRPTRAPQEHSRIYQLESAGAVANHLCRSLTFHIDSKSLSRPAAEPAVKLCSNGDLSANGVTMTLYTIECMLTSLPNLRRVALVYSDWGFDDIFDQCRLMPLPRQVTHLELRYAFSEDLERVAKDIRERYIPRPAWGLRWGLPNVKKLTVVGAPVPFIAAVMVACPNLEALELPDGVEVKGLPPQNGLKIAPVQNSVREKKKDKKGLTENDLVVTNAYV